MSNTQQVFVSFENISPRNGTALSPAWVGFHNGDFDSFDAGQAARAGIEQVAEDGLTTNITREFSDFDRGAAQATIAGPNTPDLLPGEGNGVLLDINNPATSGRYLSYAAMILPSNDTFVANDNSRAIEVFDDQGRFIGADFVIRGNQARDAGTEVNDEIPANTALFGQVVNNTGVDENGVIGPSSGLIPNGPILSSEQFGNADFTRPGYEFARLRVFNAINGDDNSNRLVGLRRTDDYINGGKGRDILVGRSGNDRLLGGGGRDDLHGGTGNDELFGGGGRDKLLGGRGNDELFGGGGNDLLRGGAGNDDVRGGTGNDKVFGGRGNDDLRGGRGNDKLFGGRGNDVLRGEAGHNKLYGGSGSDTYVLSTNGVASVHGFNLYQGDRLSLGSSSVSFNDLDFVQSRGNTIVKAGSNVIATLHGVQAKSITRESFI